MAQKRMLDKKISVSEQVANLTETAQLLFTWSIPHADDLGLLPKSPRTLKALILPMRDDVGIETFEELISSIINQGLFKIVSHNKTEYLIITKFNEHQTLKKDRKPNTYIPEVTSWEDVETLDFHVETNENPSKGKLSKTKGSKDNNMLNQNFDLFWLEYPRKVSKKKTQEKFEKINPDKKLFDKIIESLKKVKQSPQWTSNGGKFIPHPSTWLNQERWNDEVDIETPKKQIDNF